MKSKTIWDLISVNDSAKEIEDELRRINDLVLTSYSAVNLLRYDSDKVVYYLDKALALSDFLYFVYVSDEDSLYDAAEAIIDVEDRVVVKIGFVRFTRTLEEGLIPVCLDYMKTGDKEMRLLSCKYLCERVNKQVDRLLKIAELDDKYPFERILEKDVTEYICKRFKIDRN